MRHARMTRPVYSSEIAGNCLSDSTDSPGFGSGVDCSGCATLDMEIPKSRNTCATLKLMRFADGTPFGSNEQSVHGLDIRNQNVEPLGLARETLENRTVPQSFVPGL